MSLMNPLDLQQEIELKERESRSIRFLERENTSKMISRERK